MNLDPVILAPMSGVTDRPFRRLARKLGAGLVVSEMIASREMIRARDRSLRTITDCASEYPMSVQLAGTDPEAMAEAAKLNEDRGAALIDINMGCPVKKVTGSQAGSALMRDLGHARSLLEATVAAVRLPVTLKMRLGWDETSINAPELARIAEECGIAAVTVHGRTRCQFFKGTADWRAIRAVKDSVRIPVIGNGDVSDLASARALLDQSGADAVMVGRACYGRPWLPGQINAGLTDQPVPDDPSVEETRDILIEHYDAVLSHFGRERGIRIARKHLAWYTTGLPGANAFREQVNKMDDPLAVNAAIRTVFDKAAGLGSEQRFQSEKVAA